MTIPTLNNPPITEAIIELRFSKTERASLSGVETFCDSIRAKYPVRTPLHEFSAAFAAPQSGQESQIKTRPSGFRLTNTEKNRVVFAQLDRIAVSYLPPYPPWPALCESMRDLYFGYRNAVQQERVIRLGLRYVNRLRFPFSSNFDFDEYLRAMPRLPKDVNPTETLSAFDSTVVIPLQDVGCVANVRQVLEQANIESIDGNRFIPVALDIDVYCEPERDPPEPELWERFEQMRVKKNQIFRASLTPKALEPYI
ncbi:MAG: TIGR04255 family protein [Gammaproteobacteria bacterium]|nr:TIGR04255 family protein [Gammaproteobacteria bacterium]